MVLPLKFTHNFTHTLMDGLPLESHRVKELAFTAVTRVQIPSGTPNLFSNLRFPLLLYIGTKKAQFSASTRMHFIEAPVFSHRSRHFEQAQIRNTSQQTGLNQQPLWTPGEDE